MDGKADLTELLADDFDDDPGGVRHAFGGISAIGEDPLDDPRAIGEALKGSELSEFWKYRVGDDRVIASIDDRTVRIIVVCIGDLWSSRD